MFLVYISNLDGFAQERCDRNIFDLNFPLWFYALVCLAGLLLLPWFHLIGCIVFKIILNAVSSLNLNWIYGHRPANKTTIVRNSTLNSEQRRKTRIQRQVITQPETINTTSMSGYSSYSHVPTSIKSTHLIKPRNPVHSEYQSVCSEFNSD